MSIADTVDFALTLTEVDFRILRHRRSATAAESAHRAHIGEEKMAKAVALKDHVGALLAVLPADRSLDLGRLRTMLHRPGLEMMDEDDLSETFYDCETGAVPPLGPDYRVPTVIDASLMEMDEIYFEAGDHRELVHVSTTGFRKLMRGVETLDFSEPASGSA